MAGEDQMLTEIGKQKKQFSIFDFRFSTVPVGQNFGRVAKMSCPAGVAELADARDSKSRGLHWP